MGKVGGIEPYDKDFVFAKTPQKDYKLADIGQFLVDLDAQRDGRHFGPALWPGVQTIAAKYTAPPVRTLVIYNSGFDTPAVFQYSSDNLGDAAEAVGNEPGDGTITS